MIPYLGDTFTRVLTRQTGKIIVLLVHQEVNTPVSRYQKKDTVGDLHATGAACSPPLLRGPVSCV